MACCVHYKFLYLSNQFSRWKWVLWIVIASLQSRSQGTTNGYGEFHDIAGRVLKLWTYFITVHFNLSTFAEKINLIVHYLLVPYELQRQRNKATLSNHAKAFPHLLTFCSLSSIWWINSRPLDLKINIENTIRNIMLMLFYLQFSFFFCYREILSFRV